MSELAVIQYIDDPAIALDTEWRVLAANDACETLLGSGTVAGEPIESVFGPNRSLADRHADRLSHYPDAGGVVDGDDCHFDPDHAAVAALRDHRDPSEDDPDLGVFTDGTLAYFHCSVVTMDERDRRLLVFRDITQVKDREQDLNFLRQVMGRVLRHNLRNDISVVRTHAELIAEQSDDERAEWARKIVAKSDTLVDTTETTRLIEKAIEHNDPIAQDLETAIEAGTERVRANHPEAATGIRLTDLPTAEILALRQFEQAIADTIRNAVEHAEDATVEVSAELQDEWATITVEDDGPGIPTDELAAFERRGETDMTHASGAGLWLLYTVVHESGGEVAIDTEGGTTVHIRLPVEST
ncbi:hypothetical protein BRC76_05920 [Halobacteriales archaeon QH_8_67_36]|nr:MAG: hypothetical protein BRC76_05920 [Halobacteriales archaeon QH_8_67_36]